MFRKFNQQKGKGSTENISDDNDQEENTVHLELNSPEQVDRIVKDYKMVYIAKHQPKSLKRRNKLSPLKVQA